MKTIRFTPIGKKQTTGAIRKRATPPVGATRRVKLKTGGVAVYRWFGSSGTKYAIESVTPIQYPIMMPGDEEPYLRTITLRKGATFTSGEEVTFSEAMKNGPETIFIVGRGRPIPDPWNNPGNILMIRESANVPGGLSFAVWDIEDDVPRKVIPDGQIVDIGPPLDKGVGAYFNKYTGNRLQGSVGAISYKYMIERGTGRVYRAGEALTGADGRDNEEYTRTGIPSVELAVDDVPEPKSPKVTISAIKRSISDLPNYATLSEALYAVYNRRQDLQTTFPTDDGLIAWATDTGWKEEPSLEGFKQYYEPPPPLKWRIESVTSMNYLQAAMDSIRQMHGVTPNINDFIPTLNVGDSLIAQNTLSDVPREQPIVLGTVRSGDVVANWIRMGLSKKDYIDVEGAGGFLVIGQEISSVFTPVEGQAYRVTNKGGEIYLYKDGAWHYISNTEDLTDLGFSDSNIRNIDLAQWNTKPKGADIVMGPRAYWFISSIAGGSGAFSTNETVGRYLKTVAGASATLPAETLVKMGTVQSGNVSMLWVRTGMTYQNFLVMSDNDRVGIPVLNSASREDVALYNEKRGGGPGDQRRSTGAITLSEITSYEGVPPKWVNSNHLYVSKGANTILKFENPLDSGMLGVLRAEIRTVSGDKIIDRHIFDLVPGNKFSGFANGYMAKGTTAGELHIMVDGWNATNQLDLSHRLPKENIPSETTIPGWQPGGAPVTADPGITDPGITDPGITDPGIVIDEPTGLTPLQVAGIAGGLAVGAGLLALLLTKKKSAMTPVANRRR